MLLQEVRSWPGCELFTDVGWTLLLPFRGNLHVMFARKKVHFRSLIWYNWGSVHLPCHNSDATQGDLVDDVERDGGCHHLRRHHRTSRIVIGSDLNVSLAPCREGVTGTPMHPNANSAPARWREAVTEWMHSPGLRALCTE